MAEANKTYGFTIAVKELRETVPNIFRYAAAYKRKNNLKSKGLWEMFLEQPEKPEVPPEENKQDKLPDEILQTEAGDNNLKDIDPEAMEGESYNMCHFWSNFEIARLDWFRSKEYEDFFTMMDRSGGFWNERVCYLSSATSGFVLTVLCSGVMLPSTLLLLVLSSHPVTFTTSVTSATVTLPSSIAPPMPRPASSPVSPTSRRPQRTRRNASRKTSTGRTPTRSRKTVSVADVVATLTSSMSRASKAAVSTNGLMWLVVGLRHKL